MKVKIFTSATVSTFEDFEQEINEWIQKTSPNILKISTCSAEITGVDGDKAAKMLNLTTTILYDHDHSGHVATDLADEEEEPNPTTERWGPSAMA